MKITLDRSKYNRRLIPLLLLTIALGSIAVLVVIMNIVIHGKLNMERIIGVGVLVVLTSLFAYLTKFYFSVRKLEYVITYENGVLNDFSKLFNKALGLKKEDIESITLWSSNRGMNQYKLVKKNFGPSGSDLANQLKGNHIYLTDYIVNSEELLKLIQLIESEQKMEKNMHELKESEILDNGPFYHGTKADLKLGDLLTAGFQSNYKPEITMNHIYFTALVNGAGLAAEIAAVEGTGRVYIVEPTGSFENDPNVTDKKFPGNPTRSYRSKAPLRIVGEVTDWVRLTPGELQVWRERIAKINADPNAEIIN